MRNAPATEQTKDAAAGSHGKIYAIRQNSTLIGAARHPTAAGPRVLDKTKPPHTERFDSSGCVIGLYNSL